MYILIRLGTDLSIFFLLTDTSPEFYPKITSSRTYDDRLDTLGKVRGQPIDY